MKVRFKSEDIALRFKRVIEEGVDKANKAKTTPQKVTATAPASSSFGDKFRSAAGSWECGACMVRNDAATIKCVACQTPKPGAAQSTTTPATKPSTTAAPFKFGFAAPSASITVGLTIGVQ